MKFPEQRTGFMELQSPLGEMFEISIQEYQMIPNDVRDSFKESFAE